jgi:hypothetical protein
MEGSSAGIMDGKTQIRWTLGSSHDTQRPSPQRIATGAREQAETLRARLITATVEVLAQGSNPRLVKTGHTRTAA